MLAPAWIIRKGTGAAIVHAGTSLNNKKRYRSAIVHAGTNLNNNNNNNWRSEVRLNKLIKIKFMPRCSFLLLD